MARQDSLRDGNFLYGVHIHIYPKYPTQFEKKIKEIVSGFATAVFHPPIPHQRLMSNNIKIEDFPFAMEIFGGATAQGLLPAKKKKVAEAEWNWLLLSTM